MARDYFFAFGGGNPATNASLTPTFITFVNNAGTTFAPPAIAEKYPGSGLYYVSYGATQTMAFVLDGATSGLATTDRYISGVFDPYDQFGVTLNSAYALGVTNLSYVTQILANGTTLFALDTLNFGLGTTAVAGITLVYGQGSTLFALDSVGNSIITFIGNSLIAQSTELFAIGSTLSSISSLGSSFLGLASILGTTASSYGSTNVDPVDVMGYLKRNRELMEGNQVYTKATGLLDLYVRGGATLLIEKTISDTSTQTTKS